MSIRGTRHEWPRRALPWIAVITPFLLLAWWRAGSGPGLDADDYAQYLMHARALVEGRSYGDIPYIYSPYARWVGPKLALPGLPFVLAGVQFVFGPNLIAMKVVMLCFAIAFILLAALYFGRHASRHAGLAVALLLGLSPGVVHGSTQLLTDLPFAALIWAVIYVMDLPGSLTMRRVAAVTILGGAAMLFRTAGIAVIPALMLYTLLRYREQRLTPLVPVAIWVGGLIVSSAVLDLRQTTVLNITPDRIFVWLGASHFGLRHGKDLLQAMFESHLYPFPVAVANDTFHLFSAAVMVLGLATWLLKAGSRFSVVFAVCYGFLLLIAPVSHTRYVWPLFPFFLFGLVQGIEQLAKWLLNRRMQPAVAVLSFAVLLALGGIHNVIAQPRPRNLMELPDVVDVVRFVQNDGRRERVRVSFFKPRSFALATGIPTMGPIGGKPECVLAELDRREISHIIVSATQSGRAATIRLREIAPMRPDLFTLEHQNTTFKVYRFHRPAAVPAAVQRACLNR